MRLPQADGRHLEMRKLRGKWLRRGSTGIGSRCRRTLVPVAPGTVAPRTASGV